MNPKEILLKYFGYRNFRSGQEDVINSIISGRDVVAIMPTGGGKSICYQVPALLLSGITIVVSPLISLMKDQVMSLKENGIPAAYINSSLSSVQIEKVFENIKNEKYKIVYIAPERLDTKRFLSILNYIDISLVAVDEAHCISEWGQDFRPSYLKISDFINILPKRPVVSAFTATATELVRNDIVSALNLHNPYKIVTGFDRANLYYDVLSPKNKSQKLLELLEKYDKKSGIIYCSTRKRVEKIYEFLYENSFSVTKYHAGLTENERHNNQDDFVFDKRKIIVATNAFGMGIDKSNVSFVIHYNMPKSLEEYYQEAGRAGRDGADADCILLFSSGDISTAKFLIENSTDNDELSSDEKASYINKELERLDSMVKYCKTSSCYRECILEYFGEKHSNLCENCGNCLGDLIESDITTETQKIMSCIKRVHSALGYYVGTALIIRVLKGSKDKRIVELSLNNLSTYGIMKNFGRNDIQQIIDKLIEQDYLTIEKPYSVLKLGKSADDVLFGGEKVTIKCKKQKSILIRTKKSVDSSRVDFVFERLRDLRLEIANKEGVPAFIVFSNATLLDMARKLPQTTEQFLNVSGVGDVKAEKYAKVFIEEIKKWAGTSSEK